MKRISRDAIQRMVGGISSSSSFSSSGGGGGGGVSQYWVDDNYVSKEFFNRLFEIHDENGDPILPNDVETEIDNIQAMFGFWTNAYLSALGNNPGGGGAELTLASLADVAVQGVTDGQALVWNATLQKWVPGQGGGIDITAMWAALAQSGTQQIDASHLGTALTGYATQSWVTQQGYLTSSSISDMATKTWVNSQIGDMATKTWVGQNYLGLHATADAATKLATPRTLWGQSFDGTANVSGTITSSYFTIQDSSTNPYLGFTMGSSNWYLQYYNNAMYMGTGTTNSIMINSSGNVGIGTTSPSHKLHIGGTFYASGNSSIGGTLGVTGATTLSSTLSVSGTSTLTGHVGIGTTPHNTYVLRADGEVYVSTGLYSHGYVTALSDIRHKDVMGDVKLTVSDVANAPAVKFLWKDRRQEGLQVGSIAQYWKKILPEAIVEAADGELTMSYGVVALLASIANAREIVNLKREISELKRKLQKHGIFE